MYRKQVRRRRAVLVLLVVACLMLISISISEAQDGPLHSVQNGVSSVLNSIGEGASRALKPGRDMVNWFSETLDARGENDDLKSKVAELQEENTALEAGFEKAGYSDDLDKLMQDAGLGDYEAVDATVISHPYSAWYSRLRIDKGSDDGVATDDAVVTDQGLIGRVEQVGGGWADVVLLTDGTNSVTARVSGKGPVGSVESVVGAPGRLAFNVVQGGGGGFEQGDKLVTASFALDGELGSRLPPNIPIGEIDQDVPAEQDIQDAIRVAPYADFEDLNDVSVLTGGP